MINRFKPQYVGELVFALLLGSATVSVAEDSSELSRQATDPTASLMAFNVLADYTASYHGANNGPPDDALAVTFRPVIPFEAFGKKNILRLTLPYQTGGRGDEGLGAISVFDLVVFDKPWGRWGVGAVANIATDDDAPDDLALGPALGAVWQRSKRLNLGVFSQNVFAGDTAVSSLQPVVAYQLGHGWSLSAGDLQFAYDWEDKRWLSVPIGFQLGKVTRIAGQAMRVSLNPQYNLIDDEGFPEWKVTLTWSLLVPAS